jgi:hypothetical protein
MKFDILGAELGEAAIGRGSFCVTLAIAQHPAANAQHRRLVADPRDGAPNAFERIVAPALMEQRFRQTTIQSSVRLAVTTCALEISEACSPRPGGKRGHKRVGVDRWVGKISTGGQLSLRVGLCKRTVAVEHHAERQRVDCHATRQHDVHCGIAVGEERHPTGRRITALANTDKSRNIALAGFLGEHGPAPYR